MTDLSWMTHPDRTCLTYPPDSYFPTEGGRPKTQLATRLCPVKTPCLTYAVQHDLQGIWGGTTQEQRRKIAGAA